MTVLICCILSWEEDKQLFLSHNYDVEQYDWYNPWGSLCDCSTCSANLLSEFCRQWFSNFFPYNQGRKKNPFLNHCQIFLYFTQNLFTQVVFCLPLKLSWRVVSQGNFTDQLLNIYTGSLLSSSEAFLKSCFSRSRKLYWSTFKHHSVSRMGAFWMCTLAYSLISSHSKQQPTS